MVGERVGISEVPVDGRVTVVFEETDLVVGPENGDNFPELKVSEREDWVPGWPPED